MGFVLQQDAAQQAPTAHFLRLQLIADLFRRPRWLAGLITMVAGQLLSGWVIGHMVLSLGRSFRSPAVYVGSTAYWPFAGAAVVFLVLTFAELGRRRSAGQRAILTGISAGLVFGIADALTRRTAQLIVTGHLAVVLTSWPGYSLIAVSLTGIWLMESAFNAGPLHISLPGITAAEPVSGIVLGIVVFRDSVHVSPGTLALQAAGLAALLIGVIMVARSPALGGLGGPPRRAPAPSATLLAARRRRPSKVAGPSPVSRTPTTGFRSRCPDLQSPRSRISSPACSGRGSRPAAPVPTRRALTGSVAPARCWRPPGRERCARRRCGRHGGPSSRQRCSAGSSWRPG